MSAKQSAKIQRAHMATANAIAKERAAALYSARRFTSGAFEHTNEGLTRVGYLLPKLSDGYYQA